MATVTAPQFTESVDSRYFLEPLSGPKIPKSYLDRFPDALYNKAPDSHFMRFMYTLLGPAGAGWLHENILQARLLLEELGIEQFDLEHFFGDPFSFGRVPREAYSSDVANLLTQASWQTIRAQDAAYRSRAIEYVNGARLGTTTQGMKLAAQAGLGQNVEVIENYRALFDAHCDDPIGIPHLGSSLALGEFVVRPRAAVSRTMVQTVNFDQPISAGAWTLALGGANLSYATVADQAYITPPLPHTVTAQAVQAALEARANIGKGNVTVTGGPIPNPFTITFTGHFANQDLPLIVAKSDPNNPLIDLATGIQRAITVVATQGAVNPASEVVGIADMDRHHMEVALDYLRPLASYPTFSVARGLTSQQLWSSVFATSEYTEVARFVVGSPSISWPAPDGINWIQPTVENQAPTNGDLQHNYVNFHNPATVNAYADNVATAQSILALPLLIPFEIPGESPFLPKYRSEHVGNFSPGVCNVMPFFNEFNGSNTSFSAAEALADTPESLAVTGQASDGTGLIERVYPITYVGLQGSPTLQRRETTFWASLDRASGTDFLDIDLGSPQAVNFICFEITQKPVDIAIAYDVLDQTPDRSFAPVTPLPGYLWEGAVFFNSVDANPWRYLEYHFNDGLNMMFTRYIRLAFARRVSPTLSDNFLYDPGTQAVEPWTIDVRNLRIGRNVAPTLA